MKLVMLLIIFFFSCCITKNAQAVYVDSNMGNDKNPGTKEAPFHSLQKAAEIIGSVDNNIFTIKINPGIYILDHHLPVKTEKELLNKRIIIEASILPGDTSWTPNKMPVIDCKAMKGEISAHDNFVVGFLIKQSHVTIRGLKFHGYFYPHVRYFPVARFDKSKTDLLVEQCLFVGDANISQIQSGVIAHGDEVLINHCVFYGTRNTVVFFMDSGNGIKEGNGIINSIIYGVSHGVWVVAPDKDFRFENNIVSNCRYVFVKSKSNPTKYSMKNCIVVNNKYFTGMPNDKQLVPDDFEIEENNITKEGSVTLVLTGVNEKPFLDEIEMPLPVNYMHPIDGSLGSNLDAGLFMKKDL